MNRDESIEQGLVAEQAFFDNTEPWQGLPDKSLLGTKNLRVKLAELQMNMIRSSFKSIKQELKAKRDKAALAYQELGKLPSNLSEKRFLFQRIKEEISNGISSITLGGRICSTQNDRKMRPSAEFQLNANSYQTSLNSSKLARISETVVGSKVIVLDDECEVHGEVVFINDNDDVFIKQVVDDPTSSIEAAVWKKPGELFTTSDGSVYHVKQDNTAERLKPIARTFVRPDPKWISDFIRWNRSCKLPIFIDPDVFNAIVVNVIENEWVRPGTDLLESTSELMGIIAEEFILEAKLIASFPLLKSFLTAKASMVIEDLTKEARKRIDEFVTREKMPYTQNHYIFENLCKLRTQRLMDEVLSALPAGEKTVNPAKLAAAVTNIFKRNQERSVDDHMAEEMQHALNSYGKVAIKRFIDSVPMICIEIMQKFPDRMNAALLYVTDIEIERIVVAPQNIISTRDSLKREIDALEKGLVALRDLF